MGGGEVAIHSRFLVPDHPARGGAVQRERLSLPPLAALGGVRQERCQQRGLWVVPGQKNPVVGNERPDLGHQHVQPGVSDFSTDGARRRRWRRRGTSHRSGGDDAGPGQHLFQLSGRFRKVAPVFVVEGDGVLAADDQRAAHPPGHSQRDAQERAVRGGRHPDAHGLWAGLAVACGAVKPDFRNRQRLDHGLDLAGRKAAVRLGKVGAEPVFLQGNQGHVGAQFVQGRIECFRE